MRFLAILVGAGIIAAATYVTIESTGGFSAAHAPLAIAIACGVIIGAVCIGRAWSENRKLLALFIALALLSGEAWGLLSTAERIIAARETAAEPARKLGEARRAAEKRLAEAKAATADSSPRLVAAQEALKLANQTVAAKASEKACVSNCRALLNKAVDDAAAEVAQARRELDSRKSQIAANVQAAQDAFDALPPPKSETPLADRIGWQGWALDLLAAALASVAANGLGAALVAFGAHGRHPHSEPSKKPAQRVERASEALTIEAEFTAPARAAKQTAVVLPLPAQPSPQEQAARFGIERLVPAADMKVALGDVHAAYRDWCAERGTQPLPAKKIAAALADLFADSGLDVEELGSRLYVTGVTLAPKAALISGGRGT